jgi:protein involved in plasmid replication-relaxation
MRSAGGYGELAPLLDSLGERDVAILRDLARVRVLTGGQLTRLHFNDLSVGNRERARRRVLARLVEHRLVATLEGRTIGGTRAGSSGLIHSLGTAGQRALPQLGADTYTSSPTGRVRAPWTPGSLFLAHSLAIAELMVDLRERERAGDLTLAHFVVESAAWHPDGHGGVIKPDAYVRIHRGEVEDCWWVEVDRATESIPTLRRKLLAYVEFARTGQVGPDEITPRVLVTVPHDHRLAAVRGMINSLPSPAAELIMATLHDQAAELMINILRA